MTKTISYTNLMKGQKVLVDFNIPMVYSIAIIYDSVKIFGGRWVVQNTDFSMQTSDSLPYSVPHWKPEITSQIYFTGS